MTYDLFLAHPTYSSWSLRAWLIFEHFDLPYRLVDVDIYGPHKARDLAPVAPADTVPAMLCPDGTAVGDSLAMVETLHERHPEAGLWPKDASARATARWVTADMHSGLGALRGNCPMVLSHMLTDFTPPQPVLDDLTRLETRWDMCLGADRDGPWLFGDYSIADAFYAPVAMRIAGYGLPVSAQAAAYVDAHLADPVIGRWRAMGAAQPLSPLPYDVPGTQAPWPTTHGVIRP